MTPQYFLEFNFDWRDIWQIKIDRPLVKAELDACCPISYAKPGKTARAISEQLIAALQPNQFFLNPGHEIWIILQARCNGIKATNRQVIALYNLNRSVAVTNRHLANICIQIIQTIRTMAGDRWHLTVAQNSLDLSKG